MKHLEMKAVLFLFVVNLGQLFASEITIFKCENRMAGNEPRIVYWVTRERLEYTVIKLVDDKEVARLTLSGEGGVEGYAGTYIFFANLGRSGYLMLYSSQNTPNTEQQAVVDVNLFQESMSKLNTAGPRTDFICETP